jgi:AcrR family transcriptional regulator
VPERRQEILDTAIAIADENGLDAVSMRTIADRVGVTPMALYPHVGNKERLLDLMVGQLLGGLLPAIAPAPGGWRGALGGFARAARGLAQSHPWAVGLLFSRPSVAPDAARMIDWYYAALLDAGVPEPDVPRLERMISTFVLGYVLSEAGGRFGGPDARVGRGRLPEGALPAHARLAPWLERQVDWDAEFEADLDDLARLIETAATRNT